VGGCLCQKEKAMNQKPRIYEQEDKRPHWVDRSKPLPLVMFPKTDGKYPLLGQQAAELEVPLESLEGKRLEEVAEIGFCLDGQNYDYELADALVFQTSRVRVQSDVTADLEWSRRGVYSRGQPRFGQ
jgi:hypothetical protein